MPVFSATVEEIVEIAAEITKMEDEPSFCAAKNALKNR
jgi:hypothetical protein